ncbi:hypothetical protein [Pseudomonas trivialis]|nr:hypothetical protein [Pseudomonas trivialis]
MATLSAPIAGAEGDGGWLRWRLESFLFTYDLNPFPYLLKRYGFFIFVYFYSFADDFSVCGYARNLKKINPSGILEISSFLNENTV